MIKKLDNHLGYKIHYITISASNFTDAHNQKTFSIIDYEYDLKFASKYFGPFPSSTTVKTTLKKLRRVFPWCSNPIGPKNKTKRPCFYYHLGQCPGACIGVISVDEYKKTLNLFTKFMALSPPKSIYASSIITNWFLLFLTISSISIDFNAIEVGAFGFAITI